MNDFEQTSFFPKTKEEAGIEREKAFFAKVLPVMHRAAASRNAKETDITWAVQKIYSSAKFRTSVICRLSMRGKSWYLSIPDRLQDAIPADVETKRLVSEPKYLRIPLKRTVDPESLYPLVEMCTLLAIESVPKEFDCCSRVQACSDAKVCIHPDPALSMLCGYRKILKSGRVFYGKNRNIE